MSRNHSRAYDFNKRDDLNSFISRLPGFCPVCDRRIWRRTWLKVALVMAVGFFAVIGFGGFVMAMAQVLGF